MTVAEASVVIKVDASQAAQSLKNVGSASDIGKRGLDKVGNSAKTASGKMNSLKGSVSQLGNVLRGVAGVAVVGFLRSSASAASSFEAETNLLNKGLKNVGAGSAELDRLQKSADKLGKDTLFNEDDFRRGFGLLTSFGNIGVKSYDDVAMAAANVAQVSGTGVSSAFMQLAKALNDPVTNLSALSRSGIQFSEQQKEQIKTMVESGNAAQAQALILGELNKQYGGTALAAAQGAAGVQDTFGEAMYDLQKAVGGVVNTALPPLLTALTGLINGFTALPAPVQTFIIAVAGLAAGVVILAPAIMGMVTALKGLAALKIGATIAGWLPAIASIGSTIGGILPIIAGVFSGPVGWIALLAGAGVAIYAFRDQIAEVFGAIGQVIAPAVQAFTSIFVDPVIQAGQKVIDFFANNWEKILEIVTTPFKAAIDFVNNTFIQPLSEAISSVIQTIQQNWSALQQGLISPFQAAANVIRGVLNSVLTAAEKVINGAIGAINKLISGVNAVSSKVGIPPIPKIPNVSIPKLAEGGMVNGAQLAIIGEAGPEYVVPEGKAEGFAKNILAGARGPSAIPRMAEGGYVGPVNITTGPVMQQGGTNYVTMAQFQQGVRDAANAVMRNGRSYGARRYSGIN